MNEEGEIIEHEQPNVPDMSAHDHPYANVAEVEVGFEEDLQADPNVS